MALVVTGDKVNIPTFDALGLSKVQGLDVVSEIQGE